MYRWRAFENVWSELLEKHQSGHSNLWKASNYDARQIWSSRKPVSSYLLKNSDCVCPREPSNTRQTRKRNTSTHSESIKVYVPMVKGKKNGLTFPERSVKICRFLALSPPCWKSTTTMQCNRSAHTAWVWCKRSILLINVFLLGAKLLSDCCNPLSIFARFRLVHAGREAEMLTSSWWVLFERDF